MVVSATLLCYTLVTLQLQHVTSASADPIHQRNALLELFNSTGGGFSTWVDVTGWNTTGDHCSWYGVTCDATGIVQGLFLGRNGLSYGIFYLFSSSLQFFGAHSNCLCAGLENFPVNTHV